MFVDQLFTRILSRGRTLPEKQHEKQVLTV